MIKQRMCIACNARKNKLELYKIVADEGRNALLDEKYKINARSIYLCKDEKCINTVIAKLQKGKANVKINVNLESLKELLGKIKS